MRNLLVAAVLCSTASCFDVHDSNSGGCSGGGPVDFGGGFGGWGSGADAGAGRGPDAGIGDCPGSSICSPKTPNGLKFAGAVPIRNGFPNAADHNHIAVEGTDDITLKMINADNSTADLELPYVAYSTTNNAVSVDMTAGPVVTLRGHGGTTDLLIIDPVGQLMYDRYAYASSAIAGVLPVSDRELITTGVTGSASLFVFAPGAIDLGVALINTAQPPNRLVDTSLALTLAGATQTGWDTLHIPAASLGHLQVGVESGGLLRMMDVEVTDTADAMTLLLGLDGYACFGATTHGAFISGLTWSFTVSGQAVAHDPLLGPNCVANPSGTGTFTVTASAGGQTLTITTVHPQQSVTRDQLIDQVTAARAKHAD